MANGKPFKIQTDLEVAGEILNKASTTKEGVVQLNDSISSTSITQAATANAVKIAYDKANHSHPYAPTSHTHSYLPLSGGTMANNVMFNENSIGLHWSRNTDYAKIYFKNDGDGDTDSYLGFEAGDNGNEFFKFLGNTGGANGTTAEWASIKSDGIRVKGTKVSLEGHTHNSIVSRGNVTCESGASERPAVAGLSMSQAYNNGYPTIYGNIINLRGTGDGQILVGWAATDGAHAPVYVRSKRDLSSANWSGWAQFYTTANPQTTITGNAGTATKLATIRTINGTNFDGTANITTANWGTARTLTIGNTGKSVNGSGNVSWSLSEIGAAPTSHTHPYLPLTGGTMTSNIQYKAPASGGVAYGYDYYNNGSSTRASGIGCYGNNGVFSGIYLGVGDTPWNQNTGLYITSSNITWKGQQVYHAGRKPTCAEIGALPLTGGTMTSNILFNTTKTGINWSMNTDYAKIYFKNDSDGDADSYLGFHTGDNNNEYFKFLHSQSGSEAVEWASIKSDGIRVKGTKVSLEGHAHGELSYSNNFLTLKNPNDYAGLEKKNNVNIDTWYGFSISNKCSGCSVPVDGVAFSVDARTGNTGIRGRLNADSATLKQLLVYNQEGTKARTAIQGLEECPEGDGYGHGIAFGNTGGSTYFCSGEALTNIKEMPFVEAMRSREQNVIASDDEIWFINGLQGDFTTRLGKIARNGNLMIAGAIYEGTQIEDSGDVWNVGARVYSPNNKPKPDDIGALSLKNNVLSVPKLNLESGGSSAIYSDRISTSNKQVIGVNESHVYLGNNTVGLVLESNENPSVKVGSATYKLYHTGSKPNLSDIGGGTYNGNLNVSGAGYFGGGIRMGGTSNNSCAIYTVFGDGQNHNIVDKDSTSNTIKFGIAKQSFDSTTIIRGTCVRLYAHNKNNSSFSSGVFLGTSGTTAVTSDENLKDICEMDERYMDFFDRLDPVPYKYKGEQYHRKHLGFGARKVEKALADSGLSTEEFAGIVKETNVTVDLDGNGDRFYEELYSLRYEEFIALNTMAIKKLQTKVEKQDELIQKLEERLQQLENR